MVLPGAGSKSNGANFSYFDHVAVMQAVSIERSGLVQVNGLSSRDYMKLHVIKSYKGYLPPDFFVEKGSSAACGQDFRVGAKFLAFFDAVQVDPKLTVEPDLPLFHTTLLNFTLSHKIDIDALSTADEIIQKAKQR
ncbi:hypothetical protein MGN01_45480 [Methylobacterium gnaphalii]|uniref:Uncharacterized protein n=2 Tax=Methylobacterium gnaphalii TaxID=1010610 RepID=A0A512JS35_9HYPH|nr:hypothetical protein MGN01_45480 [Methylobacterium gnaphalii]GLS50941.1 hypothetical protein GCM10007885_37950 [Methylobacterium gnaphalii]